MLNSENSIRPNASNTKNKTNKTNKNTKATENNDMPQIQQMPIIPIISKAISKTKKASNRKTLNMDNIEQYIVLKFKIPLEKLRETIKDEKNINKDEI
jgi:hypothetical protein